MKVPEGDTHVLGKRLVIVFSLRVQILTGTLSCGLRVTGSGFRVAGLRVASYGLLCLYKMNEYVYINSLIKIFIGYFSF